jgi:hypothetical protein
MDIEQEKIPHLPSGYFLLFDISKMFYCLK